MSNKLADTKLFYQQLLEKDSPFVWRYGNPEEIKKWQKAGEVIPNAVNETVLTNLAQTLGKIRADIHARNEHDTGYRLMYIQKGPQTIEDIRRDMGAEIAQVVQSLRSQDEKQ